MHFFNVALFLLKCHAKPKHKFVALVISEKNIQVSNYVFVL